MGDVSACGGGGCACVVFSLCRSCFQRESRFERSSRHREFLLLVTKRWASAPPQCPKQSSRLLS